MLSDMFLRSSTQFAACYNILCAVFLYMLLLRICIQVYRKATIYLIFLYYCFIVIIDFELSLV